MYRVEYTYPDSVQQTLDHLDRLIAQEQENLNKRVESIEGGGKGELWAFSLQQIAKEHSRIVAPLYEAKSRILNNAMPLRITITKD